MRLTSLCEEDLGETATELSAFTSSLSLSPLVFLSDSLLVLLAMILKHLDDRVGAARTCKVLYLDHTRQHAFP